MTARGDLARSMHVKPIIQVAALALALVSLAAELGASPSASPLREQDGPRSSCTRPSGVVAIGFSGTKYPNIRRHYRRALDAGWPRRLVLNRAGAGARRDRLLRNHPTRAGMDRDEYPPAIGRGRGRGLRKGSRPRGWKASVKHISSSENRSHGATLGIKLRRFCNGTRFRYVFY